MEAAEPLPFLRETLLFLTLVGILIPLLQRFRVNQVIGFLAIGIVVGPYGAGSLTKHWPWLSYITIPRREGVQALAELGVVFLMFLIGLELSMQRVWAMRKWVFGVGTAQVLACGLAIGAMAHAFGNRLPVAAVLGLVLSLSSTAVVMQLMAQSRTLATPIGQASFAILMLQDMAVVPLLIIADLLAQKSTDGVVLQIATKALLSVCTVGLILVAGGKVMRPLFRTFAQQRQSEVFMALTLLVTLSIAGATAAVGLSMAMGAFLAGLLLAETEYRHEVEVTIEPFKGLLMGLFFMSVGMGIDLREVLRAPLWIGASVAGLLLIKSVITAGLLRLNGFTLGRAVTGGTLLSQGGEFAFIVIGSASHSGLLAPEIGQFMLLVVSLSLLATPLYARLGYRLGQWLDARAPSRPEESVRPPALPDASGHVVVIGFGRVGQVLGGVFQRQGVPYSAVENNAQHVARLYAEGVPICYGNASRPELLRKLGLARAACLVVTMDEPGTAMRVVRMARREYPELPIYARSHDEQHADELRTAGATVVVPETLEAGLLLTSFALHALGWPGEDADTIVSAERTARFHPPPSGRL